MLVRASSARQQAYVALQQNPLHPQVPPAPVDRRSMEIMEAE